VEPALAEVLTMIQVPKQTQTDQRRRDIQGLRAVAVLAVVFYHAGVSLPGGFLGVDVFFVISGFVITAMLHREYLSTGTIRFRRFYRRRLARLTPALATMVAVTILASAFILSPFGAQQMASETAVGAMLFSANFIIAINSGNYFDAPAATNPLLNTWSLSVEEQFYFVFPLLLILCWSIARKRRVLRTLPVLTVGFIAVISFALVIPGVVGSIPSGFQTVLGFYSPLTRAWEFALGALLSLLLANWRYRSSPRLGFAVATLGAALLIYSFFFIPTHSVFPGIWTLLPVSGTVLLIFAGTDEKNSISKGLSSYPMARLGDYSYSIYLWHWPFIVFAIFLWPGFPGVAAIAALISLVPALLSFHWIESPFRKFSGLSATRWILLGLFVVIPVITLAIILNLAANGTFASSKSLTSKEFSQPHLSNEKGCLAVSESALLNPEDCLIHGGAGKPVYLVGDSQADHFSEALSLATEAENRPLYIYAYASCPFADVNVTEAASGREWSPGCQQYDAITKSWLRTTAPGTVFIANADYYFRDPSIALTTSSKSIWDTDEKLDEYVEGLRRKINTLQSAGHEVVLIQTVPNFRLDTNFESDKNWNELIKCTTFGLQFGGCPLETGVPLQGPSDRQAKNWEAIAQLGRETDSKVIDLRDEVCSNQICRIISNETVVFRDNVHISSQKSASLAPYFEGVLGK
jgi:peptidoglycan/LPS O-acetylase OafA/YrhL